LRARSRRFLVGIGIVVIAFVGGLLLRLEAGGRATPAQAQAAPPRVSIPVFTNTGDRLGDREVRETTAPPAEAGEQVRGPDEWQGMLVDTSVKPPCRTSQDCGLARACKDGVCAPCARDAECAAGEVCALEHCVPAKGASCRRRADCSDDGAMCVLTGYTGGDPRGNRDMRARCVSPNDDPPRLGPHQRRTLPIDSPRPSPSQVHSKLSPAVPPERLFDGL
jgi:hypothetical protein